MEGGRGCGMQGGSWGDINLIVLWSGMDWMGALGGGLVYWTHQVSTVLQSEVAVTRGRRREQ